MGSIQSAHPTVWRNKGSFQSTSAFDVRSDKRATYDGLREMLSVDVRINLGHVRLSTAVKGNFVH